MAHVETWYRCPVCSVAHGSRKEAVACRDKHPIESERWAVGKHQSVRIFANHTPWSRGGEKAALFEADLSPFIEESKKQIAAMKKEDLPPYW